MFDCFKLKVNTQMHDMEWMRDKEFTLEFLLFGFVALRSHARSLVLPFFFLRFSCKVFQSVKRAQKATMMRNNGEMGSGKVKCIRTWICTRAHHSTAFNTKVDVAKKWTTHTHCSISSHLKSKHKVKTSIFIIELEHRPDNGAYHIQR